MNIAKFMTESTKYCDIDYSDMDDMTDKERRDFLKEYATDAYHNHGFDWGNDITYDNAIYDGLIVDIEDDSSVYEYCESLCDIDDFDAVESMFNRIWNND